MIQLILVKILAVGLMFMFLFWLFMFAIFASLYSLALAWLSFTAAILSMWLGLRLRMRWE